MNVVRVASDERPERVHELRVLNGWVEKARGLLGTAPDAIPVMLTRCGSVHTFGMRYGLDVAFVDRMGVVLDVRRGVPPREFLSHPDAWGTIERPARDGEWLEEGEHVWIVSIGLGMAV